MLELYGASAQDGPDCPRSSWLRMHVLAGPASFRGDREDDAADVTARTSAHHEDDGGCLMVGANASAVILMVGAGGSRHTERCYHTRHL